MRQAQARPTHSPKQKNAENYDAEETEEVALEAHKTSDGDFIGKVEIPDDPSKVMRGGEAAAAADFANYFCSYAFLYHQKQMLTDQVRLI